MKTTQIQKTDWQRVIAVPPLARKPDTRAFDWSQNDRLLAHMVQGGIRRFLYGGNAFLYHLSLAEYTELLDWLAAQNDRLLMIPSAGPSFGRLQDQAPLLRARKFPAVMHLPCGDPRDAAGLESGLGEFADASATPLILYLKDETNFGPDRDRGLDCVAHMVDSGICVGIKYAVVRTDPSVDPYLEKLLQRVDRSLALKKYDAPRAQTYRISAEMAMAWAEAHPAVPDIFGFNPRQLLESANLAAVWMYSMTGEARWHTEFLRTFRELNPEAETAHLDRTRYAEGPWGAAAYALMTNREVDAETQARCRLAFVQSADKKTANLARWIFGIDPNPADYDKRLNDPWDLILAHRITNAPKYLLTLERSAQYALGLNPANASFTSGMGARQVTVFNLDAYHLGIPLPEGITTYGPYFRYSWGGASMEKALAGIYPEWKNWPWAECIFNVRSAALNEYTVGGNMANQLLLRGYLAQQYARTRE
jgi:hypothetical protein